MHAGYKRIEPVDLDDLDEDQRQAVASLPFSPGGIQEPFRLLLHNPSLTKVAYPLSNRLRYFSVLSDKARELATMIVAHTWKQGFEWQIHVPLSLEAGIDRATIEALSRGERPADLDDECAAVYEFSHQLHETKYVDEEIYQQAVRQLGEAGVLELCWLSGFYVTLAMVMNVAGTAPSWPEALEA